MARIHFTAFALFIGLGTAMAHAGPLLPCVTATLSAQGNILVLNDLTYDDPDETHGRRYAGGDFAFSSDNQKLIYTARNGKMLHVSLSTGEIMHE